MATVQMENASPSSLALDRTLSLVFEDTQEAGPVCPPTEVQMPSGGVVPDLEFGFNARAFGPPKGDQLCFHRFRVVQSVVGRVWVHSWLLWGRECRVDMLSQAFEAL